MAANNMGPDNIADYLRDADTVTIATKRASGKDHETPIWAVTVDGVPYVRSVNGSDALWYQDVMREGGAAIVTPDGRMPVKMMPMTDHSKDAAIDAAYTTKYAKYSKDLLAPEFAQPAHQNTLMVMPPK
jgi:hypothetical protein